MEFTTEIPLKIFLVDVTLSSVSKRPVLSATTLSNDDERNAGRRRTVLGRARVLPRFSPSSRTRLVVLPRFSPSSRTRLVRWIATHGRERIWPRSTDSRTRKERGKHVARAPSAQQGRSFGQRASYKWNPGDIIELPPRVFSLKATSSFFNLNRSSSRVRVSSKCNLFFKISLFVFVHVCL